jgi:gliding motility-associated-like protein
VGTPSGGAFTPIFGLNTSTGEYVGFTALPGTHTITYTYTDATTGCSNSDSKSVLVNTSPSVSMSPTLASTYCPADGPILLTGSPSGGAFALNGTFTSLSTYSYDPTTPGTDSIAYGYIEPTTGCGGFSYQVVTVQSAPPTPILSPVAPYTFCATSPVTLTVTNPSTVVTWYSDAALTSVITTGTGILTSVLPAGSGTAYVTNSLGSGCGSSPLSFTYTNYDFSGVSFGGPYQACPGSPTEIEMSLPSNVLYAWLPDSGINDTSAIHPVVISQATHTYTVFLQINSMPTCSTYDSVQVVVAPCSLDNVTNAFSPDGDGVNDTWIIAGIDQHPDNKVTVFNRWGDKLMHFNGYNNSTVVWDGKYKGTLVASGTYYFVIEYPDDGQHAAGWLQLNY